eukprot:jgi/Undpi1/3787/HiC_scaffold_16.g07156.m1
MRASGGALRPRASFDLDGGVGKGTSTAALVRSSKRPRLGAGNGATGWWETSGTRTNSRPDPDTVSEENVGFQSTWGIYEEGGGKDVATRKGVAGCCTFRWPDSMSTNHANDSENRSCRDCRIGIHPGRGCDGQQEEQSGNSTAGQGGGASAAHPNAMELAVGAGRQESQMVGDRGCPALGEGGGSGGGGAGGNVVISSGFGSGGFPKHPWHQDQGGSCDDMLILYGSPS